MKKAVVLLSLILWGLVFQANAQWEPSVFSGSGYMSDNSGDGLYVYTQAGAAHKAKQHRWGAFVSLVVVDVNFNNYRYRSQELAPGMSFDAWGKVTENYNFGFWFDPALKFFRDHGQNLGNGEEARQNDYGVNVVTGAGLNDKLNRYFHSYKLQLQFQQAFWSKRQGTWLTEGGYLSDSVNFKAVNKTYLKTQFESTVKKIKISEKLKFEPKLVVAYLYDGGSRNSMYEGGVGFVLSFMKAERYYEAVNLQYRARFGKEMNNRLDLIELNVDFINLYKLIK